MAEISLQDLLKKLRKHLFFAFIFNVIGILLMGRGILFILEDNMRRGIILFLPSVFVFAFALNYLRAILKQRKIVKEKIAMGYAYVVGSTNDEEDTGDVESVEESVEESLEEAQHIDACADEIQNSPSPDTEIESDNTIEINNSKN